MNQFARPGLAVTQLPSFNENDKGKVLTINSESGALGWEEGSGGGSSFPSTETASAGDVLSLDDNKDPQWAAPSGGGGVLVVTDTDGTLNKTFKEINDAFNNGCLIIVLYDGAYWYQSAPIDTENLYMAFKRLLLAATDNIYYIPTREYVAESVNDYPVCITHAYV